MFIVISSWIMSLQAYLQRFFYPKLLDVTEAHKTRRNLPKCAREADLRHSCSVLHTELRAFKSRQRKRIELVVVEHYPCTRTIRQLSPCRACTRTYLYSTVRSQTDHTCASMMDAIRDNEHCRHLTTAQSSSRRREARCFACRTHALCVHRRRRKAVPAADATAADKR